MSRIRLASIYGSFALSIYICLLGAAAMFLGKSIFLATLIGPVSLLEDLFSVVFARSAFGRDLLSVFSLWLTFVCVIDVSMLLSPIDLRHLLRTIAANNYTKRVLTGLRVTAS